MQPQNCEGLHEHEIKLMFCITRCKLKIVISILIFTFYITNQISTFIQHLTRLVFRILVIESNLTEVSEQPRGETPVLNVMAIRDQRHANVSKQKALLVDVDVAPPQGAA